MKNRFVRVLGILVFAGGLLASTASAQESGSDAAARESAESWLSALDAGEYDRAYREAGSLLHEAFASEVWVADVRGRREQGGSFQSREFVELFRPVVSELRHMPGLVDAPAGEYIVVRYDTRFGNLRAALGEVVVLAPEDGNWRVVSYHVGP